MASSSDEQDFTDLFLGDDSTTFPTYPQQIPLPPFDPASMNSFSSPYTAQSVAPPQQQTTSEGTTPQTNKPVKRGRGYTGMPKGRPPGAKNKPKGPDHGVPQGPKKKGRPPGAKNKHPCGAHNAVIPGPNSSLNSESGSQPTPIIPEAAPWIPTSAATPPQPRPTYPYPTGYAPVTDLDQAIGQQYSMDAPTEPSAFEERLTRAFRPSVPVHSPSSTLTTAEKLMMPSASTTPEDFMTPMPMRHSWPNTSPYADVGRQGQPDLGNGLQYPPLPQQHIVFGNGNGNSNGNASNPPRPVSPLAGCDPPAAWSAIFQGQASQYGQIDLPAPTTTAQAGDDASTLPAVAYDNPPAQEPSLAIDPALLHMGAQNTSSAAPATLEQPENFDPGTDGFEYLTSEDWNLMDMGDMLTAVEGS